jgi:hypothetical protein
MEKALLEASEKEAREARLVDHIVEPEDAPTFVELLSSAGDDGDGEGTEDESERRARSVIDLEEELMAGEPIPVPGQNRYRWGIFGFGGASSNEPIQLARTSTTTMVSTVFATNFGRQIITISYPRCVAPGSPINPACS